MGMLLHSTSMRACLTGAWEGVVVLLLQRHVWGVGHDGSPACLDEV